MPPRKKEFKEKFKLENNEWKPIKPGGDWQTLRDVDLPSDAEPWLVNLRMWVCEMNQWASVVHGEIHELRDEVEKLKHPVQPPPARNAVPTPR
jgi:hypothetical protein